MDVYIAADIGGTQIRAAVYPADGTAKPIAVQRIATTGATKTPVERLSGLIASMRPPDARVLSVGVAAPGYIDPVAGIVFGTPNISGWTNLPLRQLLEDELRMPVQIGNDANLAALGEWRFGAARGHHHVLYLTISTGIGGGVISDDRMLMGYRGLAGEVGHITVLPDGPVCGCGQRGHLEAVASGTAISNYVAEQLAAGRPSIHLTGPRPSARDVGWAADKGDPMAIAAIERAGNFIGKALADFLALFNPSIVVFGGGVSCSGDLLFNPIRQGLQERVISPAYLQDLVITQAALGDDAGLVGALALAQNYVPA